MTRRDDLTPLRSVSAAYKRSQIEPRLRSNQEKTYEPRKSIASPACRAAQAGSPGRDGGAQAPVGAGGGGGSGAGYNPYDYLTTTTSAYYSAQYLMQQQAAQAHLYNQMRNAAAQNMYGYGLAQQAAVGNNLLGVGAYPWANVLATPPEPEKPLPVEIKAGELTAWRCWRIIGGGKLCSMTQPTVWEEGNVLEGDIDAGVGIHAWKTEAEARAYATSYYQYQVAIGTVELWGQVIEHDEGYRAQFGQIKEIVERMEDYRPGNPFYQQMVYGTIVQAPDPPRHSISPLTWGFGIGGAMMLCGAALSAQHPGLGPLMTGLGVGIIAASIVIRTAMD